MRDKFEHAFVCSSTDRSRPRFQTGLVEKFQNVNQANQLLPFRGSVADVWPAADQLVVTYRAVFITE